MRVRPRFFVDGCTQNSRLLRIFKSLGVTDFARVVIHHAYSAGLPPSPPLFFGLKYDRDGVGLECEELIRHLCLRPNETHGNDSYENGPF
jgi:tartrate dehydratase alpha subunit/fumarate hydratase class I-like protein